MEHLKVHLRRIEVRRDDHRYTELRHGIGQDLNATCNIDLDIFMYGDSAEDNSPLSGSQE